MTNFRTVLPKMAYPFKISHQNAILCLGSCFAEHIGKRLSAFQFPTLVNPFGILYHPISIADHLQHLLDGNSYSADELFQHQGLWHHFQFHSRFSGTDSEEVLEKINEQNRLSRSFLETADCIIITLGTARVFRDRSSGQIVANCHKLPGSQFEKKLLSVSDCVHSLASAFEKLKKRHSNINIILTLSPVRHILSLIHI